jgi:hypothetical protein
VRLTIFITALVLFASGIGFGFLDKVSASVATYAAAVLGLVFVFLPEFKKFKGLGIEAELLDRKIEEADKLIAQLRDITVPIAEMLLSATARMGRLGSAMPRHQKHDLLQRIERELRKCGVSDAQLEQAKMDWHRYNIFDLSGPVFESIIRALEPHLKEQESKLRSFPQPISPDRKNEYEQLIEERNIVLREKQTLRDLQQLKNQSKMAVSISSCIRESQVLSHEEKKNLLESLKEQFKDIEHYVKHKDFRRLSVWLGETDNA